MQCGARCSVGVCLRSDLRQTVHNLARSCLRSDLVSDPPPQAPELVPAAASEPEPAPAPVAATVDDAAAAGPEEPRVTKAQKRREKKEREARERDARIAAAEVGTAS